MGRKFIDCRGSRGRRMVVAISADSEEELLEPRSSGGAVHEDTQSCGSKSRQPSRSEPAAEVPPRSADNACAGSHDRLLWTNISHPIEACSTMRRLQPIGRVASASHAVSGAWITRCCRRGVQETSSPARLRSRSASKRLVAVLENEDDHGHADLASSWRISLEPPEPLHGWVTFH